MPLYDDDQKKQRERPDRSDRPSWRERDRRRERPDHADGGSSAGKARPGTKAAYLEQRVSSQAKASAEALFSNPERDQAVTRIRDATDADSVKAALDPYREQYGELPNDAGALVQCLQHPEVDVQLEALERLGALLPELEGPTRETTVRGISLFRMSARDMGARKAAKRVLKRNGVSVASY